MSEFENICNRRSDFRRQLLMTVSALTLAGFITSPRARADDDTDKPVVWIELGGQFERLDSMQTIFTPQFFDNATSVDRATMSDAQRSRSFSIGEEGKISFAPEGTNWVFSAAVRLGRTNAARHFHHEGPALPEEIFTAGGQTLVQYSPVVRNFGDGQSNSDETHLIVDFRAGKDVGLGLFGAGSSSIFSAGVRFAQFTSKTNLALHARPREEVNTPFNNPGVYKFYTVARHTYTATFQAQRNAQGIGPSLSWDASVPVAGSDNGMAVALNWGVNGAVLFGRQRVNAHHQTTGLYIKGLASSILTSTGYAHGPYNPGRSRTVTIPNVGGFAGLSFRYADAKLDIGYRADFFFNAIDNGIDTRKSSTLGFYGPFATIGIGVGG